MTEYKRVAAIHDLSGVGRCSLSVILPTMSVMGIQVCSVPTAVLSSHTNGFGDVVLKDMTEFMPEALNHYKTADVDFDCIYSGFLASSEQVSHCLEFFYAYPNALKVVDPVMGDNGKRYRTYTDELCRRMSELVSAADIITPNLTEASILLNEAYPVTPLTVQQMKSMLSRLSGKGPKTVVITSVMMADGTMCNVGYDSKNNAYWRVKYDMIPKHYPGTGDIFASVLTGGLILGDSLPIAMSRATDFCEHTIKTTYGYGISPREGVMIEKCLPMLFDNRSYTDYSAM
ncbi:MAG: pyridoxamine kinase [Oscillospiraceae bacterium]|nr:pyridoxamine kinase [Oscillospiraceae bacterium]